MGMTGTYSERPSAYDTFAVKDGANMSQPKNLVWIDLEMTGLDPNRHVILEIASLVTSPDLEILAEGPCYALRRTEEELARIDEWSAHAHQKSGLMDRVHASEIDAKEAGQQTLDFITPWVEDGASPLCGNTVAHDRRFLRREMPRLEAYFHYRHVDVSTLKEIVTRWYPRDYHAPRKRQAHLALDDIRESVAELQWYRQRVFVPLEEAESNSWND